VTPSSRTVKQGSSTTYTAETVPAGATLTELKVVDGMPSKATWSVNDRILTITTTRNTPRGTYTLQIRGTVGGVLRNTTATVVVR
jgi:uncharacterized protein YjdB